MTTDQDLDVALALFNDGLERQKADRRAARAIENAEKAKQQAAAELKRLQNDSGASAEDRAAAEAAYRDAVAAFNALRNGEAPPAGEGGDGAADGADESDEPAAESDTVTADDTAESAPSADTTAEDETAG